MAKFLQLVLRNTNGLTQRTEELKTFISIHNNDVKLIVKRKQQSPSPKCNGYSDASQNSSQATNFSYIKQYSNQSGLMEYNFHFQHKKI
jgi:hypothetical protein